MTQDIRSTNAVIMTVEKFIVQPCNSSQEINLIKLKVLYMQQTRQKRQDAIFIFQKASWESLLCWYWLCSLTIWLVNIDKGIWGCYDGRMKRSNTSRGYEERGSEKGGGGAPGGNMPGLCSTDSDAVSLWARRASANELLTLAKAAHTA